MDLLWIVQGLLGICVAVGAYLYRELKAKADKTHEELLNYKTHIAEQYVSSAELEKVIANFNKTVDAVLVGVARIEGRLDRAQERRKDD